MNDPFRSSLLRVLESNGKTKCADILNCVSKEAPRDLATPVISELSSTLSAEDVELLCSKTESPIEERLVLALSVEACIRYFD